MTVRYPNPTDADIRAALTASVDGDEIILPPGKIASNGSLPCNQGIRLDCSAAIMTANRPDLGSSIPLFAIKGNGVRIERPRAELGENLRLLWAKPAPGIEWSNVVVDSPEVFGNITEAGRAAGWTSQAMTIENCPGFKVTGQAHIEGTFGGIYLYDCVGAEIEALRTRHTKYSSLFANGGCSSLRVGAVNAIEAGWQGTQGNSARGDSVTLGGGIDDVYIKEVKARGGHCYGILAGDWVGRVIRSGTLRCDMLDYQFADTTALYAALFEHVDVGTLLAVDNGGNWAIADESRVTVENLNANDVGAALIKNNSYAYVAENLTENLRSPSTGDPFAGLGEVDATSTLDVPDRAL